MEEKELTVADVLDTVDSWIEAWHDGPDVGVPLHRYLGMTWTEYRTFVERPQEWAQNMLLKVNKVSHSSSETSFIPNPRAGGESSSN